MLALLWWHGPHEYSCRLLLNVDLVLRGRLLEGPVLAILDTHCRRFLEDGLLDSHALGPFDGL